MPEEKKPGIYQMALVMGIIFGVVLGGVVIRWLVGAEVDQNMYSLVVLIVGAIVGNLDRILSAFFPKK
jgi:uncharacterized membrane protein YeaQ/YmgE (transglycosylase-associated protein family)